MEYGAADLGIVGKDILLEQEPDVYEPVDLGFGFCRLVVAEPRELWERDDPAKWSWVRVATKYPRLTEQLLLRRAAIQVEIVRLDGSIELAPLVGLAERIVDLVQSGETLRANGLVEVARDRDLDRAAHRQPRVAEDRARARQRARSTSMRQKPPRRPRRPRAMIRRLDTRALGRRRRWCAALDRSPAAVDADIHRRVEEILAAVRARGRRGRCSS